MRIITELKEIQKIEKEILDYIVNICGENGLRYFLAGGTLLGAIRHKGFIPWDNDIDISMPRADYDKFISIMCEQLSSSKKYKLMEPRSNSEYFYKFIKVVDKRTRLVEKNSEYKVSEMGVCVDIFPIDGAKENRKKAIAQIRLVNYCCEKICWGRIPYGGKKLSKKVKCRIRNLFFYIVKREFWLDFFVNKMRENDFDTSNYVVSTFGLRGEKEIISRDCFADSRDIEFEGTLYAAPVGYEQYLTQMYGDYMQLPPVEERKEPHNICAYWIE